MGDGPSSVRARSAAALLLAGAVLGCSSGGSGDGDPDAGAAEAQPSAVSCPTGIPASVACLGGRDRRGAHYLIAIPDPWNGTLILHAHGGPSLDPPTAQRPVDDLSRWAVMVKAGYAWAGSSFRQGGVEVRAAAEDTENLRRLFNDHVATPTHTLLHGQSWGAGVAAVAAETFTADTLGSVPYDGVLLTSGVLAGGTRSYDFRLDLRVVYQALCHNHPLPDEPAYPLNIGLPVGDGLSRAELRARTADCLGLDRPPAQRSVEQQRRVATLEAVIRIPESAIQSHLEWGTFHFRDIVSQRTAGASPFGNIGAVYQGSDDDPALNAAVARYKASPLAVQRFANDSDPGGRIPVPVLTTRWIDDPTAFVELDAYFRDTLEAGGSGDHLVQTFTRNGSHSYISDVTYVALTAALLDWIRLGTAPTPRGIAERCATLQPQFAGTCSFDSDYIPPALDTRVAPRSRP